MSQRRRTTFLIVLAFALLGSVALLDLGSGPAAATGQGQAAAKSPSTDPASVDPAAQSVGPQAERVRELTDLRTATSKTFELADGKREWVGYGEAVHFKDANGVFREIDDSVVSDAKQIDGSAYSFRNGANAFAAWFGASAGDSKSVRLEYQGASLTFGLSGAKASPVQRTANVKSKTLTDLTYGENLVGYFDVYPGIDLFYELKTYGIREFLTLRRPTSTNEFTFNLCLNGLTPKRADDGRITFQNDQGENLFWLGQPVAVDDAGVTTKDITYAISGSGSAYRLTVTVSPSYLADPSRAYPVIVDPDLMITGSADTYDTWACSLYPSETYTYSTYLRTGKDTSYGIRRTFLRFDLSSADDINPNYIDEAYIRVEKYSGVSPTIKGYRNTASWSSGSVCWSSMPTFSNSETSTQATNDSGAWWRMYNTTVVTKWLNGTYSQYGWTIIDSTENDTSHWTTFYSCDAASPHKPEMHIIHHMEDVSVKLECDHLFQSAAGASWQTVAGNALETADDKFVSQFGINFLANGSPASWSSLIDTCAYSPYCSDSHNYREHVDPYNLLADAYAEGLSGANIMVAITGAPAMQQNQDDTWYLEFGGLAYDFGSNRCIAVHNYSSMLTWQEIRHEASHLFYAPDHTSSTACVMYAAANGTIPYPSQWCASCISTITAHRTAH